MRAVVEGVMAKDLRGKPRETVQAEHREEALPSGRSDLAMEAIVS